MDIKSAVFKDSNNKILFIAGAIKDAQIQERVGNHSFLNITVVKDLPPFFQQDTIIDAEYVELFDERLQKQRKYKINTIEREMKATKFVETIEAESTNYAMYNNKYVRLKLTAGTTLKSALLSVLFRDGFFDFRNNIGIVEQDASIGIAEEKEYTEQPLLEVLDDLQKIFNRYLIISDDGQINFYKSIGKTVDVNYVYGLNFKNIKQKIDKNKVVKRVIGKGKDNTSFTTINNSKDYVEDGFILNGNFGVFEETELENKHELLRKTKEELNKYKQPVLSYEIETNFIQVNTNMQINEIFNVADTINIYNPYFSTNKIQQKVVELTYNPFYPWKNPQIVLGEKQIQLVEFLQSAVKDISKIKRSITS
ncbi:phage minor structural protein, N-terminal region [Clostridium sp. USBA 49]|uniref:phage tail spike protein n=1 Tax=Clostridium sp. USBA 49 TaxID=1881060 RepID=UPI000999D2C2|nr:phage tail spike protein [Clostridium sp. USBA 49]SKA75215.1 phage minor structural protein, N-terminal region [Clostridium sp. USBA 49]